MNIFNMYVLHCILCASELKYVRIYGALQIQIITSSGCSDTWRSKCCSLYYDVFSAVTHPTWERSSTGN